MGIKAQIWKYEMRVAIKVGKVQEHILKQKDNKSQDIIFYLRHFKQQITNLQKAPRHIIEMS